MDNDTTPSVGTNFVADLRALLGALKEFGVSYYKTDELELILGDFQKVGSMVGSTIGFQAAPEVLVEEDYPEALRRLPPNYRNPSLFGKKG